MILLALLAIAAYVPVLTQPFISDDYANIRQARTYGPLSGWTAMLSDPVNRVRASSWILTYWIEHAFGLSPRAFYAASILLHVLNTWLVYSLGNWRMVGWRASALAAGFFAVYEGHAEAVMWYSASNELLQFFFGVLCLLSWIAFIQASSLDLFWYAASFVCFLLALASKESAVVFVALLLLPFLGEAQKRRRFACILPFLAIAAIYSWSIFETRAYSFRFHDGSFSLQAPAWITWTKSVWRLFWVWGFASIVTVIALSARKWRRLVMMGFIWVTIALVPYCFLTYDTHVPSRQAYLASAGLAWIVSAGFLAFRDRFVTARPFLVYSVAALLIVFNCGNLWTKKRSHFLTRAAPTEALIEAARRVDGPIHIRCTPSTGWNGCHCFPYSPLVAEAALELATTKPAPRVIWSTELVQGTDFCWQPPPKEQNWIWQRLRRRRE